MGQSDNLQVSKSEKLNAPPKYYEPESKGEGKKDHPVKGASQLVSSLPSIKLPTLK